MIKGIRLTEKLLGDSKKHLASSEKANRPVARRSLVASQAIKKGESFTETNLTTKRPGTGISAFSFFDYLGTVATKDFSAGEQIK